MTIDMLRGAAALLVAGALAPTAAAQEQAEAPVPPAAEAARGEEHFGLAMYGEPRYGADFEHFGYVDPDAPVGGTVTMAAIGTFDTLNQFTVRGVPAAGLGNIYDTLMVSSEDEPFTEYPLLAESVEVPEDRSWVAFTLRADARWHDGEPVTVEDVIWTFHTLRDENPFYASYYANVAEVVQTGDRTVRFVFGPDANRELPLILGQLPVLPQHYWEGREFGATTLEVPLGSGPYRISAVDPGRGITYERVEDYWGRGLPVNEGRHNFGTIDYDYYRDATVAREAFKAGRIDFWLENVAKEWATGYDVPPVRAGRIRLEEIDNQLPAGMQGFVYNTRRPVFEDEAVREALAYAFDFEWMNQNLFHGQYERTDSYFENSELEATGLPSPEELELLEPLRDQLSEEVFLEDYEPPTFEDPNALRRNLRTAARMLEEAGWVLEGGRRVNAETGQPLEFEILLSSPTFERVALPFARTLERLGVRAEVRVVDTAQYENRLQNFDFDMIVATWGQSLSPGNEQRDFWGSAAADMPGSRNYAGVRSEAVDRLVELVVQAETREDLLTRVHALDRVLLSGDYVIPHWHSGVWRVAFWEKLEHPEPLPPYGLAFDAWWVETADATAEAGD